MTITNISEETKTGVLLSASSPVILNIAVDSLFTPRLYAAIYKGNGTSDTEYITSIELINYSQNAGTYLFTANIMNIVRTFFGKLDDHTISENSWEELDDIYDVTVYLTATNGVDSDVNNMMVFTVWNAAAQYGESNIISSSSARIYTETANNNKYWCAENNIVYIYQFSRYNEIPSLTPDAPGVGVLIDSDEQLLSDNENNLLIG